MASPIEEAFDRIIREIYWEDSLDNAERTLASYLSRIDDDLREVLLEKRKRICSDVNIIIDIVRIEILSENVEDETVREVLLLKSLIDLLFLAQCTSTWSKMGPERKARILAPLYRAWYGLRLATAKWPESVDRIHLRHAYDMIDIAYERAEEEGILGELYNFLEDLSREAQRQLLEEEE